MSISDRADGAKVFELLASELKGEESPDNYVVLFANERGGAFAVLVSIVLSQNTNDKNSIRAFEALSEKVGVDLHSVLRASEEQIGEAIRRAGLWPQKARAIKALAELVASKGGEAWLEREEVGRLREELLKVRGVGEKTVDVFLSFYRGAPVFAVDTHAKRVARRWGLARGNSYSEISRALLSFFGPELAERAHRLIIALGRKYCRARAPRCAECPLASLCPSSSRR
ncbi:MAG: endonuclease III [Acidilobaceae archaeon]|nr:endonuclease III [Acidilobaceae archaeon]MCX8165859.1 endonuclease III [Acidilobaceae archaeon]MDW7974867.1 endonuclease III [Sulfolobales archaeon]